MLLLDQHYWPDLDFLVFQPGEKEISHFFHPLWLAFENTVFDRPFLVSGEEQRIVFGCYCLLSGPTLLGREAKLLANVLCLSPSGGMGFMPDDPTESLAVFFFRMLVPCP